jgi:hypothetical protein
LIGPAQLEALAITNNNIITNMVKDETQHPVRKAIRLPVPRQQNSSSPNKA